MADNLMVRSFFDSDWYKITQAQVIYNQFPRVDARYQFVNRGKHEFPDGFADALREQVKGIESHIYPKDEELIWIEKNVRYLKPTFLEWLKGYRYDADEVHIIQHNKELEVVVGGPWRRTVFWEVPLMATISELYYKMHGLNPNKVWQLEMKRKGEILAQNQCHWADFGTRRRFAYFVQDAVVDEMKKYAGFFTGTSNPHLAMKHGIKPIGTYAHEGPMAMQIAFGYSNCNKHWMDAWVREYEGDLGIALPDTVTTEYFLTHQFSMFYAKLFDGVRQDSGDPEVQATRIIEHYRKLGIDSRSKRLVFSDGLDANRLVELNFKFRNHIMVQGGIGTNLTNDCGQKPMNIVIKLIAADFGNGFRGTVKLSDSSGKHTGEIRDIEACEYELFGR